LLLDRIFDNWLPGRKFDPIFQIKNQEHKSPAPATHGAWWHHDG
jgi:hypothetical protein